MPGIDFVSLKLASTAPVKYTAPKDALFKLTQIALDPKDSPVSGFVQVDIEGGVQNHTIVGLDAQKGQLHASVDLVLPAGVPVTFKVVKAKGNPSFSISAYQLPDEDAEQEEEKGEIVASAKVESKPVEVKAPVQEKKIVKAPVPEKKIVKAPVESRTEEDLKEGDSEDEEESGDMESLEGDECDEEGSSEPSVDFEEMEALAQSSDEDEEEDEEGEDESEEEQKEEINPAVGQKRKQIESKPVTASPAKASKSEEGTKKPTSVSDHFCAPCKRQFKSPAALQQHSKDKHGQ